MPRMSLPTGVEWTGLPKSPTWQFNTGMNWY